MATNETPVRFGIMSCAEIARKVSRAINLSPNSTLYAISSRSLEKANNFAIKNSLSDSVKIYGNYSDLLNDPFVDAIYMPLPTSLHIQWAVLAAEKKKHLLLEKPTALDVIELDRILEACERNGVRFMDTSMWYHHPRTGKMRELLCNDKLFGKVKTNNSLLLKWLWRYTCKSNSLWRQLIALKYGEENQWCTKRVTTPYGVGLWRNISKNWSLLIQSTICKVGDGRKGSFWGDNWLGHGPIKNNFPDLCSLVCNPNMTMQEACGQNGWDFSFRRSLNDWEVERLAGFLKFLKPFQGTSGAEDCLIWRRGSKGIFTVKSAYETLTGSSAQGVPLAMETDLED